MKFLTKINRNYLIVLFSSLLVISILGYFILKKIILEEAKEKLVEREVLIKEQLKKNTAIPSIYPVIEVKKIAKKIVKNPTFNTVYIKDSLDDFESEKYIEYATVSHINNSYYSIKLRQLAVDDRDLLGSIATTVLALFLIIFISTFLINKKLTKTIWGKFEYNLNEISNFSFNNPEALKLVSTDIDEFERLNSIIQGLTDKLQKDYISAKEFTENASHEIQTPLSIILMNLEATLQENLPKKTSAKIYASYQSATKLQKLTKNLLLLSKIENRQFSRYENIDLSSLIKDKLISFKSLITSKNIKLTSHLKQEFLIAIHPILADILINNLLSNAINHNIENGFITISVEANRLTISNSSKENSLTENEFFERFKKGNTSSESNGLGLSIVKKIIGQIEVEIHLKHTADHMVICLVK